MTEYTLKDMRDEFPLWVGIDLDGVLAYYDEWQGPEHIGDPIPEGVALLYRVINQGISNSILWRYEVRIFTSRACKKSHIKYVKKWLKENNLPDLKVVCVKDHGCRAIYDDKAIRVEKNTGRIL